MRIDLGTVFIALGSGVVLTALCVSAYGNLYSGFFGQLDKNRNREVSFEEWRSYHAKLRDWAGYEWDFRAKDCNGDQRLTWWEWRDGLRHRRCKNAPPFASRPVSPPSKFCESIPSSATTFCVGDDGDGGAFSPPAGPMRRLEIPQ